MLDVIDLNIEFHDHLIPETVVYDFDLHMDPGDIVGLVGESGSGKSMSAMAIAGLLSRRDMKKRGQILFEGTDLLSCERSHPLTLFMLCFVEQILLVHSFSSCGLCTLNHFSSICLFSISTVWNLRFDLI